MADSEKAAPGPQAGAALSTRGLLGGAAAMLTVYGAGYELDAYFIGAASDWTYLAEPSYDVKTGRAIAPQLVMVPTGRVNAVTVTLGDTDCSPTDGRLGTTKATAS
ncbi:hypothetical protein AB0G35_17380 [Streptomyces sp. NPDC021749]|uniref:hypothetical protein n=1 Tax=Streptomyces sp. NPDC021749 TaxID=3154905 RepID=UPI0033EE8B78